VGEESPQGNGSRPKAASNGHRHVGGYRVLRELESDSLGSVYEAEHPRLQRRVAVRTIGANVARKATLDYALSNSFGFGGTNAALIFKRWSGK